MEGKWLSTLLSETPAEIEWLVKPLIPTGGSFELYGKTGVGKSFLAAQLVLDVAEGKPFLGRYPTKQGKVVYIQGELTERELSKRFETMSKLYPSVHQPVVWLPGAMMRDLDTPSQFRQVHEAVMDIKPALILLDPLSLVMSGDVNSQHDMLKLLKALDKWRFTDFTPATGLVHHTRKTRFDSSGEAITGGYEESGGSRAVIEWSGTILRLVRKSEEARTLLVEKLRDAAVDVDVPKRTALIWDAKRFVFLPSDAPQRGNTIDLILSDILLTKSQKRDKLVAELKISRAQAYRMLDGGRRQA